MMHSQKNKKKKFRFLLHLSESFRSAPRTLTIPALTEVYSVVSVKQISSSWGGHKEFIIFSFCNISFNIHLFCLCLSENFADTILYASKCLHNTAWSILVFRFARKM